MKQEINLQEIFQEEFDLNHNRIDGKITFKQIAYNAMSIACSKALDLAAKNADMIGVTQHNNDAPDVHANFVYVSDSNGPDYGYEVNKQSILQIKDWIK